MAEDHGCSEAANFPQPEPDVVNGKSVIKKCAEERVCSRPDEDKNYSGSGCNGSCTKVLVIQVR